MPLLEPEPAGASRSAVESAGLSRDAVVGSSDREPVGAAWSAGSALEPPLLVRHPRVKVSESVSVVHVSAPLPVTPGAGRLEPGDRRACSWSLHPSRFFNSYSPTGAVSP